MKRKLNGKQEKALSIHQPKSCIWCHHALKPGERVRSVHPENGAVHPQYHTFPNGGTATGAPVPNECYEGAHRVDEHVHDKCARAYCQHTGFPFRPARRTFGQEEATFVYEHSSTEQQAEADAMALALADAMALAFANLAGNALSGLIPQEALPEGKDDKDAEWLL